MSGICKGEKEVFQDQIWRGRGTGAEGWTRRGAGQKAPEEGSQASKTPESAPNDAPPDDAAGVSGGVRESGDVAAAAADVTGYSSAIPEMTEGIRKDHTGGSNEGVTSPQREEKMETSESAGYSQGFPERVEVVIEGEDQVASPVSSPLVASVLVGDISSSEEEEEQEEMDEEDSDESLECGQQMEFSYGSETQLSGKRIWVEKGEVESGEEGSLHIALSGASEEEVTSSPCPRRRQRVVQKEDEPQKDQY